MKKNKTFYARNETIKRDWYVVDAAGKVLGKIANKVAVYLRGKHKPIFTPHVDCGDRVIVINADKIRVTGKKDKQKMYFTHSGYPGGDKLISFERLMEKSPAKVLRLAVAGMLPKNSLGRKIIKKLNVYSGAEHPHPQTNLKKLEV
jgi:large subunit ribosomal protein L13